MSRFYTYCEDCDNVESQSRKRSPASWVCLKFPRTDGAGFVAPKVWADQEPFMRCNGINGGLCPMFKQLRVKDDGIE
jgi:hypothetical protein